MFAHLLLAAGSNLQDLGRKFHIMNERALSRICAVGGVLTLAAVLCVVPIRGQGAVVDGLSRSIERLQDRHVVYDADLNMIHVELASIRVTMDQMKARNEVADRYLERSFWGILAILGSILYRTGTAFWALRSGWLTPKP